MIWPTAQLIFFIMLRMILVQRLKLLAKTDEVAHDVAHVVTATFNFFRNNNAETIEHAIKDATLLPDAVANDPKLSNSVTNIITPGPNKGISQSAMLGVAGAVVNNSAALQSATDLAALAPRAPAPSRRTGEPPPTPSRRDTPPAPKLDAPRPAEGD